MNLSRDLAGRWIDKAAGTLRPHVQRGTLIHALLAGVRRHLPRASHPPTKPDRLIRRFSRDFPDAHFVQIGSNDGDQLDPLRSAILGKRWRGIMVEPVPYVFGKLAQNYGHIDRIILENVAIAREDDELPFYHLAQSDDPGLPRWYDALGSFRKDVILKHADRIPDIADRIVCTRVPSLRFDSLCAKHGIERIDVLHTDCEGYDWEILQDIDLARYRPALVIFERHHLDEPSRRDAARHFQSAGYEMLSEGLDTVCFNPHNLPSVPRGLRVFWNRLRNE